MPFAAAANRPLIVVTLLCVAVMAVPTAWAINCDVMFPATTFRAPLYTFGEANPKMQAFLLSPNIPSNVTPSGSTSCGYPSYFAQYNIGGSPIACLTAAYSNNYVSPTATGCVVNMNQGDGDFPSLVVNFLINCDPNADAAVVPPANVSVYVPPVGQGGTTTYWATVTSKLVCGAAPLFRIAKKHP